MVYFQMMILSHRHGRTVLDLSLTLRYAGLPNLAKLELVKTEKKRTESHVTIALQVPSGERIQQQFPPATALWEILEKIDNDRLRCSVDKSHQIFCRIAKSKQ